ncbi:P2X purinoceptor 7-like [Pimephales promelas]|uniref:P2X purinoceptor 7-like n=1 Tax=Pimephales promelas TaxID=90988 RepID=UPI001955C513|nr:P2X purinoceptor 7-like [Pimephales promelas]
MDRGDISDAEEIVHIYSYDGPQPYNYEPAMLPRDQEQARINVRQNGQRRQIELWCEENRWRTGQVSWCLCGKCEAMFSAEESQCCREVDAYWALVENVTPRLDVQCLTLHPGFEACCLNPYVLQIAYMHFRQDHGPLQASRHEQYRYTAYRLVVRWAYGILGRHIRKPLPACVVSAIRGQFPEEGGLYKGFEWPNFVDNQ